MQHPVVYLVMRYNQEYVHVANHITCLWATSIEIVDRLHAISGPYQQYFSHIGRCEGDS